MKPSNWRIPLLTFIVAFICGVVFAYFQFNPWGRKPSALAIFIEDPSPLLNPQSLPLLEFYLERPLKLIPITAASDLRSQLVLSEQGDTLVFASWKLINQLNNEGLLIPWSARIQDLLTPEMRVVPEFLPLLWDLQVEWKRVTSSPPPYGSQCLNSMEQSLWTDSLPRLAALYPKYAEFKTSRQYSSLELWGFSYGGKRIELKADIEAGLLRFLQSELYALATEKTKLGVSLKRFESESKTPRLRRSSFIRDIPLGELKVSE